MEPIENDSSWYYAKFKKKTNLSEPFSKEFKKYRKQNFTNELKKLLNIYKRTKKNNFLSKKFLNNISRRKTNNKTG